MKHYLQIATNFGSGVLASKRFTWFIIILFILQAGWIAFSWRFPLVYDEAYHFGIVKVFTDHLWPVIYDQPPIYDAFRDLSIGSTLLHYLLSFPLRFVSLLTDSQEWQVISLRLLNIGMAAGGMLLFVRLLREVRISRIFINIGLLFFILIPIVPYVAANINYDNALFLLTPLFLLLAVKVIMANNTDWRLYAAVLLVGMAASLVKFAFLPIFAAVVLYIGIFSWRRDGLKSFLQKLKASFLNTRKRTAALILIPTILVSVLFISTYVVNTFLYGTPQPSCAETLSEKRCFDNSVIKRNQRLLNTLDQRPVGLPSDYVWQWLKAMTGGLAISAANTTKGFAAKPGLPIILMMLTFAAFVSVAALLYSWRGLPKNKAYYFLMTIVLAYILAIFIRNLMGYYRFHAVIAVQSRYLLIVLPILMVMAVIAVNFVMQRFRTAKLGLLAVVLAVFLLGGAGLTTHILLSNPTWYRQEPYIIEVNQTMQRLLQPIIKETPSL